MRNPIIVCSTIVLITLLTWTTSRAEDLLDFVDVGSDTASLFTGHNGIGWGPEEPATHGGNWGGIVSDSDSPDRSCRVVWYYNPEDPDTLNAMVTLFPNAGSFRYMVIRVLDGIADDSFRVWLLGRNGTFKEIYSYQADPSSEEYWVEHVIETPYPYASLYNHKPLRIIIEATGQPWDSFETYGQLAVDWIELWGDLPE